MTEFRCPHCGSDVDADAVFGHAKFSFNREGPIDITDRGRCPECDGEVILRGTIRHDVDFSIGAPDESVREVTSERVFPLRYDTLKGDRLDIRIQSRDPDLVDVMRRLFAFHDLEITEFDSEECYIIISKPEWSR